MTLLSPILLRGILSPRQSPLPTDHSYDRITDSDSDSLQTETFAEVRAESPHSAAPAIDPIRRSRYRDLGRLADLFNDSNKYQYAAGERIGIKP